MDKEDTMRRGIKTWIGISLLAGGFLFGCVGGGEYAMANEGAQRPLVLRTMGGMTFGGTVERSSDGETFHGDHGYAQYFIPEKAKNYPLVFWHGIGQSGACWETTPDGREGFMQLLPRRGWAVYIMDQPRRGRAGRTSAPNGEDVSLTVHRESETWNAFRLGIWSPPQRPEFFDALAFPKEENSINRFMRWQTPDTGEQPRTAEHRRFLAHTVGLLFQDIGGGILVTHSRSGEYGWETVMAAPDDIKGVVAFEPAAFPFPEGERPAEIPSGHPLVEQFQQPIMVPQAEFDKLTKIPILIVYGDNIAKEQSTLFNVEVWRCASLRAVQFVEAVNRHGGDARLVRLPDMGIYGNTHVPFADLNNEQIADIMMAYLHEKGLDSDDAPHRGPSFIR